MEFVYNHILRNLEAEYHSWLMNQMSEWYPIGQLDIVLRTDQYGCLIYHDRDRSTDKIHNIVVGDDREYLYDYIEDEKEWRRIFANKLTEKIRKSNTVQEDVSLDTGLSLVSINRYSVGKTVPSLYNVNLIANSLNCALSEFYVSLAEASGIAIVRSIDEWYDILNGIIDRHPDLRGTIINWYPVGYWELAIRTTNNDRYQYNISRDELVYICNGYDEPVIVDEEEWREIFSDRLKELMKDVGLDRFQLAELTGITSMSIFNYMAGKATPSLYYATKIARALNITLTDFQVM